MVRRWSLFKGNIYEIVLLCPFVRLRLTLMSSFCNKRSNYEGQGCRKCTKWLNSSMKILSIGVSNALLLKV